MHSLSPGAELEDPLAPYRTADRSPPADRPWLMANMVCGLDGCVAVRGRVGALSDPVDRGLFRLLRGLADTVLVGAETVRTERYGPAVLPPEMRRERTAAGRRPVPRLAIVTRSLDLDPGARLFAEADPAARPVVVTCERAPERQREALSKVADVVLAGDASVELAGGLERLHADGDAIVLCEGGPALLGQLVETRLLDELCLTLSPVMGGDALPVAVTSATSALARFRLAHALGAGSSLFLRYLREADDDAALR